MDEQDFRPAALELHDLLAAYLAGLIVGNRPTRAHGTIVVFLDAVTWLVQIVMFVLLGLLVEPERLASSAGPALLIAAGLMVHQFCRWLRGITSGASVPSRVEPACRGGDGGSDSA